jgi:hypothetical protein
VHEGFVLAADGSGGTLVSVAADPGPTITPEAPSTVEDNQTTVVGTVTAGIAGDMLTLNQTAGTGTLSLGPSVGGVQQVIYTAPATIAASTVDAVTYTVTDEYNDVAMGSNSVQLSFETSLRNVIETQLYTAMFMALGLGWLVGRFYRPQ